MSRIDRPRVPLADRLLTEGADHETAFARDIIRVGNLIIGNEVTEYLIGLGEGANAIVKQIPTFAPVFGDMWIEHMRSTRAVAIRSCEGDAARAIIEDSPFRSHVEKVRWAYEIQAYRDNRGQVVYCGRYIISLDYDGRIIADMPDAVGISTDVNTEVRFGMEFVQTTGFQVLMPALACLGFMHCQNVVYEGQRVRSVRLEKEFERAHGRPFLAYKTISVVPWKEVISERKTPTGIGVPWHKVKGHFADYRAMGLFGKHFGIFWVPDHERGDRKIGEVHHTYNVKEPEENPNAL